MAGGADENLSGLGMLLEARRQVHAGAYARLLALASRGREIHDYLARLHADPHRKRNGCSAAAFGPANAGLCRPQRAVRIVRVRRGHPEQREDGVADNVGDGAVFALYERPQLEERLIEGPFKAIREALLQRGRARSRR